VDLVPLGFSRASGLVKSPFRDPTAAHRIKGVDSHFQRYFGVNPIIVMDRTIIAAASSSA
jgi:predicted metallopeptidase